MTVDSIKEPPPRPTFGVIAHRRARLSRCMTAHARSLADGSCAHTAPLAGEGTSAVIPYGALCMMYSKSSSE